MTTKGQPDPLSLRGNISQQVLRQALFRKGCMAVEISQLLIRDLCLHKQKILQLKLRLHPGFFFLSG